jgi:predicted nucleic acid-binding Zn ribbon protein
VTEKACAVCRTPIAPSATGRPPAYCSAACRRVREYQIRRVDRLLQRLEERASEVRLTPTEDRGISLARVQHEIKRQEARLRELLIQEDD